MKKVFTLTARFLFWGFWGSLLLPIWVPGGWKVTATFAVLNLIGLMLVFLCKWKEVIKDQCE